MNLETAKHVIRDEKDANIGRLSIAANVLALPENDEQITLSDLLLCLERGTTFGSLNAVTEVTALTLYRRTNRKRKEGLPYENLVTDFGDWKRYLTEHGLLE